MLYGAALLAVGFWKRTAFIRWQALILLVFTIVKTFLYDMRDLSQGYRVVSFLGLGALLMAISFAYQKDWLALRESSTPNPPRRRASEVRPPCASPLAGDDAGLHSSMADPQFFRYQRAITLPAGAGSMLRDDRSADIPPCSTVAQRPAPLPAVSRKPEPRNSLRHHP